MKPGDYEHNPATEGPQASSASTLERDVEAFFNEFTKGGLSLGNSKHMLQEVQEFLIQSLNELPRKERDKHHARKSNEAVSGGSVLNALATFQPFQLPKEILEAGNETSIDTTRGDAFSKGGVRTRSAAPARPHLCTSKRLSSEEAIPSSSLSSALCSQSHGICGKFANDEDDLIADEFGLLLWDRMQLAHKGTSPNGLDHHHMGIKWLANRVNDLTWPCLVEDNVIRFLEMNTPHVSNLVDGHILDAHSKLPQCGRSSFLAELEAHCLNELYIHRAFTGTKLPKELVGKLRLFEYLFGADDLARFLSTLQDNKAFLNLPQSLLMAIQTSFPHATSQAAAFSPSPSSRRRVRKRRWPFDSRSRRGNAQMDGADVWLGTTGNTPHLELPATPTTPTAYIPFVPAIEDGLNGANSEADYDDEKDGEDNSPSPIVTRDRRVRTNGQIVKKSGTRKHLQRQTSSSGSLNKLCLLGKLPQSLVCRESPSYPLKRKSSDASLNKTMLNGSLQRQGKRRKLGFTPPSPSPKRNFNGATYSVTSPSSWNTNHA